MKKTCIAIVLLLAVACSASANVIVLGPSVPLSDLINGMSISAGDKEFTDFTYAFTEDMPDATGVNVIPIEDCDGNFGIRFQGGFVDLPGGNASDALITFNVTATDPNQLISDAHLAGNPSVAGPGGFASVVETFVPVSNEVLEIFNNGSTQLFDWVDFPAPFFRTLPVQKNILLSAGNSAGASISFIDQTFSQVPEPSTGLMVLLGGFVMGLLRRR